jgi:hypothetical protein
VKLTFYVGSSDGAERCGESLRVGRPISIEGEDPLTGRIKPYEGVVLAVEPLTGEDPGERWRVAIETVPAR